jgi:hypothetical protein
MGQCLDFAVHRPDAPAKYKCDSLSAMCHRCIELPLSEGATMPNMLSTRFNLPDGEEKTLSRSHIVNAAAVTPWRDCGARKGITHVVGERQRAF